MCVHVYFICSEEDDEDIFPASPSPFSAMPPMVAVRPRTDGGRGSLIPQPVDNPPPPPPRHGSAATITPPIHLGRVPLPHIPQQREQPGPAVQPRHSRPQSAVGGSAPVWSSSGQFGPGKQEKDVRNTYHTDQESNYKLLFFLFVAY